jgi:hypothetical protein
VHLSRADSIRELELVAADIVGVMLVARFGNQMVDNRLVDN